MYILCSIKITFCKTGFFGIWNSLKGNFLRGRFLDLRQNKTTLCLLENTNRLFTIFKTKTWICCLSVNEYFSNVKTFQQTKMVSTKWLIFLLAALALLTVSKKV